MIHPAGPAQDRAAIDVLGGGEMGALLRAFDWSSTPVGPMEGWPHSLRTTVGMLLNARHPMLLFWGSELVQFYNDGFRPSLGADRHPQALGQPARECWTDAWPIVGEQVEAVIAQGESVWNENFLVPIDRNERREEVYWTYGYSPVRDESGTVAGVLVVVTETTAAVVGERRLRTLAELAAETGQAHAVSEVCTTAARVLADNPKDLPFALVFLLDAEGTKAHLAGLTGLDPDTPEAPESIDLRASQVDAPGSWPVAGVVRSGVAERLEGVAGRFGSLAGSPWPEPVDEAVVLPIRRSGQERTTGVLIAGISPRRPVDDDYLRFLGLVADQIAAALANARAYEEEKRRTDALAELNRAKTTFFGNVSHEFRTPLALILGPVEDSLADPEHPLPRQQRERQELVRRNALRLTKLVDTLLDFSRIEAGRMRARFERIDLSALTSELVSMFRSTADRAGLRLVADTPPLQDPPYVDRDMWEKVVLNLLSNAFKHTFEGEINVSVHPVPGAVQLEVRDTGTGIPPEELPHLFERFYRVQTAHGRSQEGTGIGLALVQELVKLHGGEVTVESTLGAGSVFRVTIPTGTLHLPDERTAATRQPESTALRAAPYVEEALRWMPDRADKRADALSARDVTRGGPVSSATGPHMGARIVLADDNADMRDYVARLLGQQRYAVETVPDGAAALESIRRERPDLVLADVMMPRLDGYALLAALRADARTRDLPIILLSARAGEESQVAGLKAGANDYLAKPFSARELIARVGTHLEMARVRRAAAERERALRDEAERARADAESARAIAEAAGARLREIFVNAPAIIATLRGPQHVFESANPLYLELVGKRAILGRSVAEVLPELVEQGFLDLLDRVYRTGEPFMASETPVLLDRRGDGVLDEVFLNFVYQPLFEPDGAVSGILVHAVDVTDQVRIRQEVEHARGEAEEANRAKASFLATMSHELRTPLNAIIGYTGLLEIGVAGPITDAQARQVARISAGANHLLRLIEEILTFSRIEAGRVEIHLADVDPWTLVRDTGSLIAPLAEEKGLRFGFELPDAPVSLVTDEGRARQILLNLLGNAIKFTDQGAVQLAARIEGEEVVFEVRDTGIGIAPEDLVQVFEPFQQASKGTTRQAGGAGLGLSVSRQLARLLGGDISVESTPAEGSVFTFRLPLRARADAQPG